ncbi:ankyrin [Daldinia bambusicola]|nr:ankyrin [Daldinia bambusicola]
MASLTSLPTELLMDVSEYLDDSADLNHLCLTSRRLYFVFNPILYSFAALNHPHLMCWASEAGRVETVKKLLLGGMSPNMITSNHRNENLENDQGIKWARDMADTRAVIESAMSNKQRLAESCPKSKNEPLTYDGGKQRKKIRKYLRSSVETFWFPLHSAAMAGSAEITKLLLDAGAHLDVPSRALYICQPCYDCRAARNKTYFWTPLHTALCCGNEDVANLLITRGASVDVEIRTRPSNALHWAARCGCLSTIRLLLEGDQKVPVDTQDLEGASPLIWALGTKNSVATMKCLLQYGANLEVQTHRQGSLHDEEPTALLRALRYCWYEDAEFLIDSGANIHPPAKGLTSALDQCLISFGGINSDMTNGIEFRRRVSNESGSHKWFCKTFDVKNQLRYLSSYPASNDITDTRVHFGMVEVAKKLILQGANVHGPSRTPHPPIVRAAGALLPEVVGLLLKFGARVDQKGEYELSPLLAAVSRRCTAQPESYIDTVECLLKNGANPNNPSTFYEAPLLTLCFARFENPGELEVVKLLVENGADIHDQGSFELEEEGVLWLSPLGAALCTCRLDICRYLISKGAKLDPSRGDFSKVLDYLVRRYDGHFYPGNGKARERYPEAFRLLFELDQSGSLTKDPWSFWISAACSYPLMKDFLDLGASDASWVNRDGQTCLHKLAANPCGWPEAAAFIPQLVEMGADVNRVDDYGYAPFMDLLLPTYLTRDPKKNLEPYTGLFTAFIENRVVQKDRDVLEFKRLMENTRTYRPTYRSRLAVELGSLYKLREGKIVPREQRLDEEALVAEMEMAGMIEVPDPVIVD